jgi:hypothetical protein
MARARSQEACRAAGDALNPIPAGGVPRGMKVVKVRLSGDLPGITQALQALGTALQVAGGYVEGVTSPYPNRREPGYRVYLAFLLPSEENTGSCGAAHRRQAIDRPAAAQSKEAHSS